MDNQILPPTANKAVYTAIAAVSRDMAGVGIAKNRKNEQQNYNFRGIDDVQVVLAPMLVEHGLLILPRMLTRTVQERQTQKGGTLFYVVVEAEFDFVSTIDNSLHVVRMFGEAMDSGDKATNKAMSAAYKYAAFQAFCIPIKGEDADQVTHEPRSENPSRHRDTKPPVVPAEQRVSNPADGEPITRAQQKRLGDICKTAGRTALEVSGWLRSYHGLAGAKPSERILIRDYDAIEKAIMAPGPLPTRQG